MITARQSRAARALLGWTQETLADKARISLTALKRLESENRLEVYETTRDQVRRALEQQGRRNAVYQAGYDDSATAERRMTNQFAMAA